MPKLDMNMNRRDFFKGTAVGLSLARFGFGQAAATPIQATKLTDRVMLLSGDGGNVGRWSRLSR